MRRTILKDLMLWKDNPKRKPLIVYGARQVGKTYIINQFGRENYSEVIYVNFETNEAISSQIDSNIDPKAIINKLELFYGTKITPGKTLIFFDEIQANDRALTSLKYFCENANEYHIIAAGSLLGVAINRKKYSFPVGKVDILVMNPLSFKEFLMAVNRDDLIKEIENCFNKNKKMDMLIHSLCLELYRTYLVIGGMPEVVSKYLEEKKIISVLDIHNIILESYLRDMTKYASRSESNKIIATFDSIPAQLAKENQKFQYKTIAKGGTSSIFGFSLDWLDSAGIIRKCYKVTPNLPLEMYKNLAAFKIYMSDVGLFVNKAKYPLYQINVSDHPTMISMGPLIENYVANELKINGYNLYYWESIGQAELDFIIQNKMDIIPIEVKSGDNTKSKSLALFIEKYNSRYGIRISEKNFGFVGKIKSVPLYAVFCINEKNLDYKKGNII